MNANMKSLNKSQLLALVAQMTNDDSDKVAPEVINGALTVNYIAQGKVQHLSIEASKITDDAIKSALSGSSSIDDGLTYALLSGAELPITSAEFLKTARKIWTVINPDTPFNKDVIPAYKFVQIAERIRKENAEPLLEQWNAYVASVDAENTAKRKEAEKTKAKFSPKRVATPSVNGLARLVRGESEQPHYMAKAVGFLVKAIGALDAVEKPSKAEQGFHSKLIAALADNEAKKYQG
jgi:hypothetical protein